MEKQTAPFGSWPSPISAEMISASDTRLRNLQVSTDTIWWLEVRPAERGRGVVVRWSAAHGVADVTPADSNVGTRVHEYGGGEFRGCDDMLVYSEKSDGSVWLIAGTLPPRKIVAVDGCRYADFAFDRARGVIYAVCEDHRGRSPVDPLNRLVAIDIAPADAAMNAGRTLFTAADFVASPRLSPDGRHLAWVAWDHPNMPWDHTRLLVAPADDVAEPTPIAGEEREAIEQIAWADDGSLYFTSDRSGWSNVYRWHAGTVACVYAAPHDFSHPVWQLRAVGLVPLSTERIVCTYVENACRKAALIVDGGLSDLAIGQVQSAPQPFGAGLAWIAEPPDGPAMVRVAADIEAREIRTLRTAAPTLMQPADVSLGEPRRFAVGDGEWSTPFSTNRGTSASRVHRRLDRH